MTSSESLKRFRKEFKLTQQNVADLLDMSQQSYYYYENKGGLSAENIIKLADTYNVSTDYLLGRTDTPQPLKKENDFDEQESNELTVAAENNSILDYHQTLAHILAKQGIKI